MKKGTAFFFLVLGLISLGIYFNYDKIEPKVFQVINNGIDYMDKSGLTEITSEGNLISDTETNHLEDSGLSGKNVVIEKTYYPYYGMLSDKEQILYKQVYENIENVKTTFVPIEESTVDEVNRVIEFVYNDHPEFFWMDTNYTYKYTEDNICAQVILKYNETSQYLDTAKKNLDEIVTPIIEEARNYSTDYEREKYVHDVLIKNMEYQETSALNQTMYSALVLKKSVCAGYSRSFQYILTRLGIPTYYVTGTAEGDHAWNIVKLGNDYYNVDITWDDNPNNIYAYFNLSDDTFSKTHTRTRDSVNLPKCEGKKYENR